MPRIHDFDRDPSRSDQDYIWSVFRERPPGRGELSETDLWGPGGVFLFDGIHHQCRLKAPEGTSAYDNGLVDPVYRWLEENTTGSWHWLERQTNNWRSVATSVYLREDADIEAFIGRWGDLIEYDPQHTVDNAKWHQAEDEARELNVLPGFIDASSMHHALMTMAVSGETAGWLENLRDRSGFDDLFVAGLDKAVAHALKAEPSEHGARLPDGEWNDKLLAAFRAVGEWVRQAAPSSLQDRLRGYDTAEETLTDAIGLAGVSHATRL